MGFLDSPPTAAFPPRQAAHRPHQREGRRDQDGSAVPVRHRRQRRTQAHQRLDLQRQGKCPRSDTGASFAMWLELLS